MSCVYTKGYEERIAKKRKKIKYHIHYELLCKEKVMGAGRHICGDKACMHVD